MSRDPLVKQARAAYKALPRSRLDQLIKQRVRWQRKATLATNKLEEVNRKIAALAIEATDPLKP